MSAILGLFRRDGVRVDRSAFVRMAGALAHRGETAQVDWCETAVALGRRGAGTRAEGTPRLQPLRHAPTGIAIVADARIDNRRELAHALGCPATAGDAELILHAYVRWGADCAVHLIGDFVFAIWDPRDRSLCCGRDPMGVKPFYYFLTERQFGFATEIKALHVLPEAPRALDEEQVTLYLTWSQPDRENTIFRGVRRLPAAHTLTIRADREPVLRRYWSLDSAPEIGYGTANEYIDRFRELFTEAVRCRLPGSGPVATALSGGLDSSAITCTTRLLQAGGTGSELHALSLVFPDLAPDDLRLIDERRHVDSVVAGGGLEWHPVRGDRLSPLHDIDRVLWHLDEPSAAPNLYLHWGLYAAAQEAGAGVFLDGLDGDATVSHGYGRLNGLLQREEWGTFEAEVRAFSGHRGMDAAAVLPHFGLPYLDDLARQHRWRRWARAAAALSARFPLSRRDTFLRHGVAPAVPQGLRAAWSRTRERDSTSVLRPSLARFIRRREAAAAGSLATDERASHLEALSQPAYQSTLEIADRCAAAFGVEPRYPFFDRRLMEFCVAVPDEMKLSGGWTRLIFRRAMEGILPPDVQWRSTKSNLSPNFQRQFTARDRALVERADLRTLEPYADVARLMRIRERYFADPTRAWGDPDSYLLFRAASFALWRTGASGDSTAAPARAA